MEYTAEVMRKERVLVSDSKYARCTQNFPCGRESKSQTKTVIMIHLDLIITPDTSIAHIASAFNKPVVTIHENNPDSFHLFAPISSLNRTVFSKSKSSISDFSVSLLLQYCFELISLKLEEDYE